MGIKPILFNEDMVRAILDGRKCVTRRPIKKIPAEAHCIGVCRDSAYFKWQRKMKYADIFLDTRKEVSKPYQPGDILYVRETWALDGYIDGVEHYVYRADVDDCGCLVWGDFDKGDWAPQSEYRWRASIHMPKEAARIFLRVTDVHPEPLFHITGAQAKAEGFLTRNGFLQSFFTMYPDLTMKSFVWVTEFERCEKPQDF